MTEILPTTKEMRVNQFLAHNLGLSRREIDKYISQGLVELNGNLAEFFDHVSVGSKVRIYIKGNWKEIINEGDKIQTILFYKPIFCLTTRSDPDGRKTLYHFLPRKFEHLKSAGRLDYMSEGLLVMSSDGELIYQLTHARNTTEKKYLVGTKKLLDAKTIKDYQKGIKVDDYNLNPVEVINYSSSKDKYDYLKLEKNYFWYVFTLTEGRNNQIRKMVDLYDNRVLRLIRIEHGEYELTPELYNNKYLEVK